MFKKKSKTHKLSFFLFAYWHDPRWSKFVGATVKIWDLAHNLSQLRHQVVIFLPKYGFTEKRLPFRVVEIPLVDFPFIRSLSFSINLIFIFLFNFIKYPLDVVYVRRGISLVPLFFSKLRKSILIFEINDDPYRKSQSPGSKWIKNLRFFYTTKSDELFLKACHLGIVITEEIKDKVLAKIPFIDKKLIVLPSGSNLSHLIPLDRHKCRLALKFDKNIKCIGFVGSLLSYQGINVLIEAAPYILNHYPSCIFLIIGDGPMKEVWIRKAEKEGVIDSFRFFGEILYQDLPRYIGTMDVCVAPFLSSVGLSSPVKIFDYLACGRPVVASHIHGTTNIFADSGAIIFVPPEDPKVLGKTIVDLLHDENKTKKMGDKGRSFMEANYDRSAIAKRISDKVSLILGKNI
jgi:glycosyltransferase involved in cell wall biosynthesis